MTLGKEIRKVRRRQGRTMTAVAECAGMTKSMLSKIENDAALPSVAALTRLADTLGVNPGQLLEPSAHNSTVFTSRADREATAPVRTEKGYTFRDLALSRSGKAMQPYLFEMRRGEIGSGHLTHSGEEFVYMLEGRVRYRVGAVTYNLEPGDSLYFDAVEEHDVEPLTETAVYLGIFTSDTKEDAEQ
ncbi:MAG: XRE family transcriptional regulator [Candidatus Pacebacteria bacterium]|nr:XRE family transcriptional regulator [Candidatus Paceibacterota bacterium]